MQAQCIVLAAGRSTRMGHPKALTRWADVTAMERVVATCEAAGILRPLVVLGEAHDEVRAALASLDARVRWLRNPKPEAGRTGSLQVGLAAAHAARVLVWPIDHPLVRAETLRALLAATGSWVVPTYRGRGGHPIALDGLAQLAVQTAPPATPLRELPRMMGMDTTRVEVDDEAILLNLDTPDDLARMDAASNPRRF